MGKIIVSEQVSLDGVVEDPSGVEGTERGGWVNEMTDNDREEWTRLEFAEAMGAEALLLGRRSEAWFAARWTNRTGEWADRLNGMPKYVVSSTLGEAHWANATVLHGDVVGQVSTLKQQLDGDIVVYASGRLVRTLMAHRLVDELRLTVHPCVVGDGERLFGQTSSRTSLRLVGNRTLGDGLAFLTYEVEDAS